MSRRRRLLFILLSLGLSLGIALVLGETVLRMQTSAVGSSEHMDPGLLRYDRTLGWTVAPGWKGKHVHHDFEVQYAISPKGLRGSWPASRQGERIVLVGDSFTFGLGVQAHETFAHALEVLGAEGHRQVLNLGLPGYSTDQEVLFFERVIPGFRPDRVILVVCLINDVFDNERVFPLQAMQGKPRFRLDFEKGLVLENVPVPKTTKGRKDMQEDLASLVMGNAGERQGRLARWLGRQEISRRLGLFQPSFAPPAGFFEERFAGSLDLFDALVDRLRKKAEAEGAVFSVAVLPGRSFVEDPGGYSEKYQEFLRHAILRRAAARGIPGIDLALPLRRAHDAGEGPFFHPNEGHLNAAGHAKVSHLLDTAVGDDLKGETK